MRCKYTEGGLALELAAMDGLFYMGIVALRDAGWGLGIQGFVDLWHCARKRARFKGSVGAGRKNKDGRTAARTAQCVRARWL